MKAGIEIVVLTIEFLINISSILINIFIIYALRKLDKLSNISYWFIFFLSISDCCVGLSGIAFASCMRSFSSKQDFSSCEYIFELTFFFLEFSARLTTVIAIDRSIRMKYLNRYNAIMTKTRANTILIVNTILGLVRLFFGQLTSLRYIFRMAYDLLHFVCISSSCIFYLFTYCRIKRRVADLHLNLRHSHTVPTAYIDEHTNKIPNNSLKSIMQDGSNPMDGDKEANSRYSATNTGMLLSCGEGDCEKKDDIIIEDNSTHQKWCVNKIEEKMPAKDLPKDFKKLPALSFSQGYDNGGNHVAMVPRSVPPPPSNTSCKDTSKTRNRRRNEADAGKAMLYIIIALVVCYIPIICQEAFTSWNISTGAAIRIVSYWLLIANPSINAIILVVFSREVRYFTKSLLQKN